MTYDIAIKSGARVEVTTLEKRPEKRATTVRRSRQRGDVLMPRRPDNLRRCAKRCLRLVLAALPILGCPLLITLTFDGDASDSQYAGDALSDFQKRLRIEYPECHYIFVPELSPKGRIHFHGLLFGVPQSLGDLKKGKRTIFVGTERTDRTIAKLWREGFVDLQQTDGSIRLAYYVSKYFNKGAGEILFVGMRIPRVSHGFPKPQVYRGRAARFIKIKMAKRKADSEWISTGESKLNEFFGTVTKKSYTLADEEMRQGVLDDTKMRRLFGDTSTTAKKDLL